MQFGNSKYEKFLGPGKDKALSVEQSRLMNMSNDEKDIVNRLAQTINVQRETIGEFEGALQQAQIPRYERNEGSPVL